jgi:iron complex outermembrane receptor protein
MRLLISHPRVFIMPQSRVTTADRGEFPTMPKTHSRARFRDFVAVAIFLAATARALSAQEQARSGSVPAATEPLSPDAGAKGLLDLNLDQLSKQSVLVPALDTQVTSVSRQESTVGRSPAAVFVITQEMIRRSGATSVPEALRMAPGIEVAKVDSNVWAISARGFNGRFSNKLLVQIDRRVVYTPLFGGVFWDTQDVVLQDVERIEVIRGPGTTAWGSNAVNGVINIITKKAGDTQGVLASSSGGNQELDANTVRYGGQIGPDLKWRAYGRQFERNRGFDPTGPTFDDWRQSRGGFRAEWTPTRSDAATIQGDIYNGYSGRDQLTAIPTPPFQAALTDDIHVSGGNTLARWTHTIDDDTDWQIQGYYDRTMRHESTFADNRNMYDIDFQQRFSPADRHQIIYGANYRNNTNSSRGAFGFQIVPPAGTTQWASVFAEDKITVVDDRWYLLPGARLEYNTYGRLQFEPSVKLLFLPDERRSCWASVSRAARNPTQVEVTGLINANVAAGVPAFFQVQGNRSLLAESLVAYEVGYRAQPNDRFSWDLALFYNNYRNLISPAAGTPFFSPPYLFIPAPDRNNLAGNTCGLELTSTWQIRQDWKMFGSYSFLDMAIRNAAHQLDVATNGTSPRNQLYLRSSWDLGENVEFDLTTRYVDNLSGIGVPHYITMDARLGWQMNRNTNFAIIGQNLLTAHHQEFANTSDGMMSTQVPRGVYGVMTWRR